MFCCPIQQRDARRGLRHGLARLVLTVAPLLLLAPCTAFAEESGEGLELFEKYIRPVLVRECYECHSAAAAQPEGQLRLDSREATRRGGVSGAAVVPGQPQESLLLDALRHESFAMPPDKKLSDDTIAHFQRWIEIGAPDPREQATDPAAAAAQAWEDQYQTRLGWWSLQPIRAPALPEVPDAAWSQHPVDRFIASRLAAEGLSPAARADRATRLRRLSFALRGLPPSPDEVRAFLSDDSPDAWPRLVDRLLGSPQFGERWARHWMDVVRYTDTYGYEWDIPAKGAWRYRDYLVRAFNADVPVDQLIREQIAGDLLPAPRINPQLQINESLIGPMFYQMGEKRHGDSAEFNGIHQEMLDNKIDAFSKAFQATTVACARCHDHKLDAVAQSEYYALGGIFMSARWVTNTLDQPARHAAQFAELRRIKTELHKVLGARWQQDLDTAAAEMLASAAATADVPLTGRAAVWRTLLDARLEKEPPLEDLVRPWTLAVQAARAAMPLGPTWEPLVQQYEKEMAERKAKNAGLYLLVADFREGIPEGWSVDGVGLREIVPRGDFTVALEGNSIVHRILHGGLATHALSPRMNGALRTPLMTNFNHGLLSFEHTGGDFSAVRTVVDNAFLTERQQYLNQPRVGWAKVATLAAMKERRVYLEVATKTSNPNFPPRVGLGGECSEEQTRDPKSWFGVSRVFAHDAAESPADELGRFSDLVAGDAPDSLEALASRYVDVFRSAATAWQTGSASDDQIEILNWLLDNQLLTNRDGDADSDELARLVQQYRSVERQLPNPETVNGMAIADPAYDLRLNIRGDYDQLGEPVPRGYLRMVTGSREPFDKDPTGRLELAECIASPTNPLTARVFVNRVWHWLFGTGIVATPDDFGHLGDQPSHPELLDYLAHRFMAEDWSLKQLVRAIVLSETWQQAGQTSENAMGIDPNNRLLHHYPLRRLEAEAIRDAMLAVSGRLDLQLYGPPLDPPRQNEDPQKRLFSGPLDGLGRRTIYTKITIMEPPKFLATFNLPEPKIPTGKRDITTTPAQSLALLNDALVMNQAEHWAQHMLARPTEASGSLFANGSGHTAGETTTRERLAEMFLAALGRVAATEELDLWQAAVEDLAALHQVPPAETHASAAVWKDVAHALLNTKEFLYIR